MSRLLFALMLFVATSFTAAAEGWVLHRTDGNVRISVDGKTWNRAKAGTELSSGTWIKTGTRGRAILGRDDERIVYRANTLAAVSVSQPAGQTTQVTHRRGAVFLSVTTGKRKRTSVVTPHLAAVIKGTVLEVVTDEESASVRVDKGVVEVRSDGSRVDVGAGQQAVSSGGPLSVSAAQVTSSVPGSPNTFSLDLRATSAASGNTNSNASTTGFANSNGNGNGNGNGNSNGNGNGNSNGNGNGNGNGNSNGNGNGNSNGNGNGNGNGNSNGNGNGN